VKVVLLGGLVDPPLVPASAFIKTHGWRVFIGEALLARYLLRGSDREVTVK